MRNTASCAVLAIAALAVASCSSASTSSSFKPGGSLAPTTGSSSAAAKSATSEFGFTFPVGYTVQFTAPPTSARNRAVIDALEKQQTGFRYALYVKHGDGRYLQWTAAQAAPSFQAATNRARAHHLSERGAIQYSAIRITSKIYTFPSGSSTGGTFCVVAAGVRDYSTSTGKTVAAIMPPGLYQFIMHKDPGGGWKVASVQKGGGTSCGS